MMLFNFIKFELYKSNQIMEFDTMSSKIEIKKTDMTELDVDVIVNAANSGLKQGGGVCGAIFSAAGPYELADACDEIGGCETGSAVITPGFDLKAEYIIHAVGPIWNGGEDNEEELLYSAYEKSLILAMDNGCSSIAFPVISSGIYGYPKKEAWKVALKACGDFINANPNYDISIIFAVLSERSKEMGENTLNEIE